MEDLKQNILSNLNCTTEEFGEKYRAYKAAELEFEKLVAPLKDIIIEAHKTNDDLPSAIVLGGVELSYVAPSVRKTIDSKKLKEEEPELVKKFIKTSQVSASIRIKDVQAIDVQAVDM